MMMGRGYNGFGRFGGGMMHGYFGNGFMYGGLGMLIACAVIVVLVVVAFVIIVKRNKHNRHVGSAALDELKIRFAKGEISEEEYLRKKKILD